MSTINDHELSKSHKKSSEFVSGNQTTAQKKLGSEAGKAFRQLKAAERSRLVYLFRNAHAVAKKNRPLSDYTWLCEFDKAKQLDIGSTYINDKAAADFIHSITQTEKQKTVNLIEYNPFFAFMIDESRYLWR